MTLTFRRIAASLAGALLAVTFVAPAIAQSERFSGTLALVHGDAFSAGRSVGDGVVLHGKDRTYRLAFEGREPRHLAGRQATVSGTRKGDRISVASLDVAAAGKGGGGSTTTAEGPAVAAAINKKVAFILVNFASDTRTPWSVAQATGSFLTNTNSVKNYFDESSFGVQETTGEVVGWYTLNVDPAGCPYGQIASAADAAVAAAKGNTYLSQFTNKQYVFPSISCGWSGLAYLPGSQSWLNGTISLRVSSHELSHNFGVHHASTMTCTEGGVRVSLSANSGNCTYSEYGDPFTVMGAASTRHSHTQHKAQMQWVPSGERLQVTSAGTYSLGVNEHASSTPKVIRVARTGVSNQYFYLEFRQPYGSYFDNFSSSDPAVNGVTVRLAADYSTRTQSRLVDTTPSTTSFGDAPLAVGRTLVDPLSGVSITTQSVSSSGATVSIAFSADTQAPSAPGNLAASPNSSSSVALSWSASTDNVGVAGYRVSRNGTQVAQLTGTSWTDSGLSAGTSYTYGVVAYDAAGNVSAASTVAATTLQLTDTQPPTAPTLSATVNPKNGQTTLSWTSSTDNVGVAGYRVYRDGTLLTTTTKTTYTIKKSSGTVTYWVVAFDQAGNVSTTSNSVTITVKTAKGR